MSSKIIKTVLLSVFAILLIPLLSQSVLAQRAVSWPLPDDNGDYFDRQHVEWVVLGEDPNGLNCRWSEDIPNNWFIGDWPDYDFWQWPVIRQFDNGSVLLGNTEPAGFLPIIKDSRGLPWLKVQIGFDKICMARANAAYISPLGNGAAYQGLLYRDR